MGRYLRYVLRLPGPRWRGGGGANKIHENGEELTHPKEVIFYPEGKRKQRSEFPYLGRVQSGAGAHTPNPDKLPTHIITIAKSSIIIILSSDAGEQERHLHNIIPRRLYILTFRREGLSSSWGEGDGEEED